MPLFPGELVDWLQPGAIGAGLAIVWTETRAQGKRIDEQGRRIDEQGKRIDQLRDDMKASEERQRQEMAELRHDMKELRAEHKADNRVLGEKLDRLVEALLTAKQP